MPVQPCGPRRPPWQRPNPGRFLPAGIEAAKAQVIEAQASVEAAIATTQRIEADIEDSLLKAPCAGRVQYRIAEVGEVLPAGGKVLNLVDLVMSTRRSSSRRRRPAASHSGRRPGW